MKRWLLLVVLLSIVVVSVASEMVLADSCSVMLKLPNTNQQLVLSPNNSVIVWNRQCELMRRATTNAYIVRGLIINTDKSLCLTDVTIATEYGASVNIAKEIWPGQFVYYYKFIPCFYRQNVYLKYNYEISDKLRY